MHALAGASSRGAPFLEHGFQAGVLLVGQQRRPCRLVLDTAVHPDADVRLAQHQLLDAALLPPAAVLVLRQAPPLALHSGARRGHAAVVEVRLDRHLRVAGQESAGSLADDRRLHGVLDVVEADDAAVVIVAVDALPAVGDGPVGAPFLGALQRSPLDAFRLDLRLGGVGLAEVRQLRAVARLRHVEVAAGLEGDERLDLAEVFDGLRSLDAAPPEPAGVVRGDDDAHA